MLLLLSITPSIGAFDNRQSSNDLYETYTGLISNVKQTDEGHISFYALIVFYTGYENWEHQPYPVAGFYLFDTVEIPNTYSGLLLRHFIKVSVPINWP